jgi:hypothetical protein
MEFYGTFPTNTPKQDIPTKDPMNVTLKPKLPTTMLNPNMGKTSWIEKENRLNKMPILRGK